MLQIYTDIPKDNCIISNDIEFDTKTLRKILNTGFDKYKKIISEIENVNFINDDKIVSKINGEPINITELSTGCKTIINIMVNSDKIVFATECGKNYIKYIYRLKDGKIYTSHFLIPSDRMEFKDKKIELIKGDNHIIINGIYDLEKWFYENE